MKEKAVVCWSGGKDSALALYDVRDQFEIVSLITTVTEGYDRISIHGVRNSLLDRQARSLNYPLRKVTISQVCTNEEYEQKMLAALEEYYSTGVTKVICGDIFLEDVRSYREERLFKNLEGVFPLWKEDSTELANRFISLGFQAILCCVDTQALDPKFAGRFYDTSLLADLPPTVDPCGENGEFHSFVIAGPNMKEKIDCVTGERVLREGRFCYCDLVEGE